MGNKREPFDKWYNLLPHIRKYRCLCRICQCQPMHPGIPIRIILRFGTDQTIKTVCTLSVPYYHHTDTAHTGTLLVGSFKIYSSKIFHNPEPELLNLIYLLVNQISPLADGPSAILLADILCIIVFHIPGIVSARQRTAIQYFIGLVTREE